MDIVIFACDFAYQKNIDQTKKIKHILFGEQHSDLPVVPHDLGKQLLAKGQGHLLPRQWHRACPPTLVSVHLP